MLYCLTLLFSGPAAAKLSCYSTGVTVSWCRCEAPWEER